MANPETPSTKNQTQHQNSSQQQKTPQIVPKQTSSPTHQPIQQTTQTTPTTTAQIPAKQPSETTLTIKSATSVILMLSEKNKVQVICQHNFTKQHNINKKEREIQKYDKNKLKIVSNGVAGVIGESNGGNIGQIKSSFTESQDYQALKNRLHALQDRLVEIKKSYQQRKNKNNTHFSIQKQRGTDKNTFGQAQKQKQKQKQNNKEEPKQKQKDKLIKPRKWPQQTKSTQQIHQQKQCKEIVKRQQKQVPKKQQIMMKKEDKKQLKINMKILSDLEVKNSQLRLVVQSPKAESSVLQEKSGNFKNQDTNKIKKQVKVTTKQQKNQQPQKQPQKQTPPQDQPDPILSQYITQYQQKPLPFKHTSSQSNLFRHHPLTPSIASLPSPTTYYISSIIQALQSTNPTSFDQLCTSHLLTSYQFLCYIKNANIQRLGKIIPKSLPAICGGKKNTIIFDLDQTLIHCVESKKMGDADVCLSVLFPDKKEVFVGINVRPYTRQCLKQLSKYFEIMVFTASHANYATAIVNYLDPQKKYISHKFSRQSCYKTPQGFYIKDLRIIDRPLSNMLLIDNAAYSYCLQLQNGIPIVPFYDNKADLELKNLIPYLKGFINQDDVRKKNNQVMRLGEYTMCGGVDDLVLKLYK